MTETMGPRDELGHIDVLKHEIITDDVPPICHPEKRAEMYIKVNDMLNKNLISPSKGCSNSFG